MPGTTNMTMSRAAVPRSSARRLAGVTRSRSITPESSSQMTGQPAPMPAPNAISTRIPGTNTSSTCPGGNAGPPASDRSRGANSARYSTGVVSPVMIQTGWRSVSSNLRRKNSPNCTATPVTPPPPRRRRPRSPVREPASRSDRPVSRRNTSSRDGRATDAARVGILPTRQRAEDRRHRPRRVRGRHPDGALLDGQRTRRRGRRPVPSQQRRARPRATLSAVTAMVSAEYRCLSSSGRPRAR